MSAPSLPSAPDRPKARKPRGLQDRRGPLLAAERAIVEKVLGVYQNWGFELLETPALEYADALGKFLPDQDRPNEGVFALQDDDEQWMALRYDLTAPLARFAAEHFDALPKPYRRCAAGPVWRNEKPGPGRYREFWQCDADTVGAASPAADAEMVAMACEALMAAGAAPGRFRLAISSRRLLDGAMDKAEIAASARLGALRALDKLDRLGIEGVRALLGEGRKDESGDFTRGAGLSPAQIEIMLEFVSAGAELREETLARLAALLGDTQAGVQELALMQKTLAALKVANAEARFDPSIVRGLDYYTGAVFEAQLIGAEGVGSVGGGGRYDGLVARFRGEATPATGFSIGVSRLAFALQEEAPGADGPLVVLPFDSEGLADCFAIAARLRHEGYAAEVYLGGSGPKAQLKYADKRKAPLAFILGGDERAGGTVTIKNLKLGAALAEKLAHDRDAYKAAQALIQKTIPLSELIGETRAMLEAAP